MAPPARPEESASPAASSGIDWGSKLRHLLPVVAFCVAIGSVQYAFAPEKPFAPPLAYSLCIGLVIWAIVDIGRHLFPSARETGWPAGLAGYGLVITGIAGGYLIGSTLADRLCRAFGWYAGFGPPEGPAGLRESLLVTALAGVAGCYYFYSVHKGRYLQRRMDEVHRQANEARLKLLEAQLEPHMLFNTLANLRALIGVDPVRAQAMLDHVIDYLRATLGASRVPSHPLQAEFDRLRDYLELMKMRMGPRLAFELELPPSLAQYPVPSLLLQPLVENSIQHGLEPQLGGGCVRVRARAQQGQLVLEVSDTGAGLADAPQAGKGFGLEHVRERLATLYGERASLAIESPAEGGTRCLIHIPLSE